MGPIILKYGEQTKRVVLRALNERFIAEVFGIPVDCWLFFLNEEGAYVTFGGLEAGRTYTLEVRGNLSPCSLHH